jgi:hypothetical protein
MNEKTNPAQPGTPQGTQPIDTQDKSKSQPMNQPAGQQPGNTGAPQGTPQGTQTPKA